MKLVPKITGRAGQGVHGSDALPEGDHLDSTANGIYVGDGVTSRMGGEPPRAVSKGWGNLTWLFAPWRG